MVEYKLYYFNFRGRGELVRLLFAAAGKEYDDIRFEKEQWHEYKPKSPLGQVPFLEVTENGKTFQLGQSVTITRYLARKFGLAGKGDEEQAQVESYGDQCTDLMNELVKIHFETDENRKGELRKKFTEETLPKMLKLFEGLIIKNGSGYLAASGLTWSDIYLVNNFDWVGEQKDAILAHFPHVKKLDETVRGHPNIAAWLAKRPVSSM
nr:glutathione S-transferase sigma 1-2 [Brachionus rubens]